MRGWGGQKGEIEMWHLLATESCRLLGLMGRGLTIERVAPFDWDPWVDEYNKEVRRQAKYQRNLQLSREEAINNCVMINLLDGSESIGEYKWEMQYDDITEWFELNEEEIIEILQQQCSRGVMTFVNISGRKYAWLGVWMELMNLLRNQNGVKIIDLSSTGLTETLARQLLDVIQDNHLLQRIDVGGNNLPADVVAAFQAVVDRNIHGDFLMALDRMELAPDQWHSVRLKNMISY